MNRPAALEPQNRWLLCATAGLGLCLASTEYERYTALWVFGTRTPEELAFIMLALAAALFYLRLDLRFGAAMTALLALTVWGAAQLAAGTTAAWLGWGVGLFVVGWIIQFVGHYYEGRKPAFVDDLSGLIVGPLFVLAELAFLLGLRGDVQREVEERAGPTCIREHKRAA